MVIGAWGGVVFRVQKNKTVMLKDLKESSNSNVAKHEVMAGKTKYQWINYGAEELSLTLIFDSTVCRKPFEKYMELKELEGQTSPLIIGKKRIGYHTWMLQKIDGNFSRIINKGAISRIEVTCKFIEYFTGES